LVYHKYAYKPKEKYQPQKQKFYHLEKNRIMTLVKNLEKKTLFLILPAFVFMEMGMMLYAFWGGWFKEKISSYAFVLKNYRRILKKRKKVQGLRVRDDRFLKAALWGEVRFEELKPPLLKYFANPVLHSYWFFVKRFL